MVAGLYLPYEVSVIIKHNSALTRCSYISHDPGASKARTTLADLPGSESPAPLASGSRIERKHQELAEGNLPSILDVDTVLFLGSSTVAEIHHCSVFKEEKYRTALVNVMGCISVAQKICNQ